MNLRSNFLQHVFRALILFGFCVYIVYLVKTNRIDYYIAPHMAKFITWSSIVFFVMAVYQLFRAFRSLSSSEVACDCGHEHSHSDSWIKQVAVYGLFIFPILLGFMLPDNTMGSSLAAKKGMNLSSGSLVKKSDPTELNTGQNPYSSQNPSSENPSSENPSSENTSDALATRIPSDIPTPHPNSVSRELPSPNEVTNAELDEMFKGDIYTAAYEQFGKTLYRSEQIVVKDELFIETLTTVDLFLDNFIGKKITLDGFVYRQDNMKAEQFVLARFAIQCCSADGSPMGVMIEDRKANELATDSWIRATGTIDKTIFNGMQIIQLKLESYKVIPEPETRYVYINYDFGFEDTAVQ